MTWTLLSPLNDVLEQKWKSEDINYFSTFDKPTARRKSGEKYQTS